MTGALRVDISFDVVCPWCLIGLRYFQLARTELRRRRPRLDWDVRWHGVQLLPDVPAAGHPFLEFYLRRLGGPVALRQRQAQVVAAAAAAGALIDYPRIARMPNTADAHRLLQLAAANGADALEMLLERLLCAYFEQGEDIGQPGVLLRHGAACGLPPEAMAAVLHGARPHVRHASAPQGVPYFVFNGGHGLSGAQPVAVLLAAMESALGAVATA